MAWTARLTMIQPLSTTLELRIELTDGVATIQKDYSFTDPATLTVADLIALVRPELQRLKGLQAKREALLMQLGQVIDTVI